jgi:hypothetical protein
MRLRQGPNVAAACREVLVRSPDPCPFEEIVAGAAAARGAGSASLGA